MMKELHLGPMDKVRIWRNEASGAVLQQPFEPRCRRVTVEWYGPRGPYFLYGLLGAKLFTGEASPSVRLEVPGSEVFVDGFATPVQRIDHVHAGLLPDYGEAVLSAARSLAGARGLSGSLVFDEAVYGEVGSSKLVFERLAECVVELLTDSRLTTSDAQLTETMDHILRR